MTGRRSGVRRRAGADLREPLVEERRALTLEPGRRVGRGSPERRDRDAGCRLDLQGVADEPPLQPGAGGLRMKLERQPPGPPEKGLVLAGVRGGQMDRVPGQVEVSPCQCSTEVSWGARWRSADAPPASVRDRGPQPTSFVPAPYTRAPRARAMSWAPEADSQGGPIGVEPTLQYPDLVRQKGVLAVVACADGSAQDDEQVGAGIGPAEIVHAGLEELDPVLAPGQRLRKRTQVFESHVADDYGAPAGGGCGSGHEGNPLR